MLNTEEALRTNASILQLAERELCFEATAYVAFVEREAVIPLPPESIQG